jgi:TRAP-type C4-dicarboxylate transport system substrate-binding protein
MKRLAMKITIVSFVAALTLAGCGNKAIPSAGGASPTAGGQATESGKAAATINIKASHGDPETSPRHQGLLQFAKIVDEKSKGKIKTPQCTASDIIL